MAQSSRKRPDVIQRSKQRYVEHLARLGLPIQAAKATGVSAPAIKRMREEDSNFDEACELAMEEYREHLEETVYKRAVLGYKSPVFGRSGIIGHKQVYSDRLLELHAKRHIPAYRTHNRVDMTLGGGVLAIPVLQDDWEVVYGRAAAPPSTER